MATQLENPELYTIAWIAALPIERAAATALLDEIHKEPQGFSQHEADNNSYSWGRLGQHNIVIASLPAGVYGVVSAATTASNLVYSLPHIRFGLLVGIGGGISQPDQDQDIRLGDVVISQPEGTTGGVVQYDLGKAKAGGVWEQKGSLNKPPPVLLHALASLQAQHEMMPSKIPELLEAMWNKNNRYMTKKKTNYTYPGVQKDRLFRSEYNHIDGHTCAKCDSEWEVEREERDSTDPEIHYGIIASGNTLIKDAAVRDSLCERHRFLCVEMEAAGLIDRFPCLVIRGICDYADSHKNDGWQRYAAATAAAFVVELLEHVPVKKVQETQQVIEAVRGRNTSVDKIDLNIVFDRLPDAAGARFDSQAEEHNPKCLANTRVDLLRDISSWITNEASKQILITRQLARNIPGFALSVRNALDSDPDIASKSVPKQFAALVEAPMVELMKKTSRFVIVIDALDECDGDEEIKSLIHLLSRTSPIQHCLRILITSRPDLPIRLGFAKVSGSYRTLILHDMPADTIKHDIMTFLSSEFNSIRDEFNMLAPKQLELPPLWPGKDVIDQLTNMAIPLFISAATACRFVKDCKVDSPSDRLCRYLQLSSGNYGTHLGQTYGPVLQSIVTGVSEEDLGTIVILAAPLSVIAMSKLLDVSFSLVHSPLNALHSILNVPPDLHDPVRLLHISLRDYLIDPDRSDKNEFWVDEQHVHLELLQNSLRVMNVNLKEDICRLVWPGTKRTDVPPSQIETCIPAELQYACCYWVYHLERVKAPSLHEDLVFGFLQSHLFHWIEVLSLLGRSREMFHAITVLKRLIKKEEENMHGQVLNEVSRFLQITSTVIDSHPLQLYPSLLYSIPSNTVLDKMLTTRFPPWLQHAPEPDKTSDRPEFILEGHQTQIGHCKMSLDNSHLVSCSNDGQEMRVWDLKTGECIRVITNKGGIGWRDFSLSYNGLWIVAHSSVDSEAAGRTVEEDSYSSPEDNPDDISEEDSDTSNNENSDTSSEAESGTDIHNDLHVPGLIKLWNVEYEQFIEQMFVQYPFAGNIFRFSPNSKFLVFIEDTGAAVVRHLDKAGPPREIRLTLRKTGRKRFRPYRNAEAYNGAFYYIEFSPDSSLLIVVSVITEKYAIWETQTFKCIRYRKVNRFLRDFFDRDPVERYATSFALTEAASIMVAGALSGDGWKPSLLRKGHVELEIRWLESGLIISTIHCKADVIKTQFSPDQTVLALTFRDGSVGTWRVETGECLTLSRFQPNAFGISFSPDLELIISTGVGTTASLWANHPRETDPKSSRDRWDPIVSVVLSSDYSLAASFSSRGSVKVWHTDTCNCIFQFDTGLQEQISGLETTLDLLHFTKDNRYLFAAWATAIKQLNLYLDDRHQWDGHFRGWDLIKGQEIIGLKTNIHAARSRGSAVLITPNDRWIIFACDQNVTIIAIDAFSITLENEQPVGIALPVGVEDIFAVSLDSKFLVLKIYDDRWSQSVALAMLGDPVEVRYRFSNPADSISSPAFMSLIQDDSVLLSYHLPNLDLRNSFTGQLIRRLRVEFGFGRGCEPRRMHFNTNTQQIHTNFGTIATLDDAADGLDVCFSIDKHLTGYGISADRSWLLWKNKQIFWLPPTFRPKSSSAIEVFGSTIIIGTSDGRVLFFKFNNKDGPQLFQ
ncbi:uncharacterized protein B0J16DRAFT_360547 [Fusarium flagelliforme]|uniref:uncharacterized protein n=1 Tax=Fusarium flagelliforme TaxID=2675880 RepID=UPI001E8DDB93|nr:uncharacterized protein B0J16DRAFT_360547 [Fusarium flagelliforme]KAH7198934.1 hypothetical protein B0J16DRAFT_360547 [Fusarium flagelliforme]